VTDTTLPQPSTEAVEAALIGLHSVDCWDDEHEDCRSIVIPVLTAALPFLREQWEAERRARIRGRSTGFTMVGSALAELSDEVDRLTADLAAAELKAADLFNECVRQKSDLAAARQQLDAVRELAENVGVRGNQLRVATFDPGGSIPRALDEADDPEPIWLWQARAVAVAILALLAVAPTGDAPTTKDGE
jgi:hypothetical protein